MKLIKFLQNLVIFLTFIRLLSHKNKIKIQRKYLEADKTTYNHGKIINIYIVYEISKSYNISNCPRLESNLFGAVKLTKNPGVDEYKYPGYGVGFDGKGQFSFGNGYGRNVIIFGVGMTSSVHVDNKEKKNFNSR